MSLILNIETSTKTCSVSLTDEGKVIRTIEEVSDQYIHAEKLNVFIEQLLQESGYSLQQLSGVCVSKGPGSYTGLRIGVSCAKGLCYALNIPLIAIDSLTILAKHFLLHNKIGNGELLVPAIDARRMEIYTAVFNIELVQQEGISAKIMDESAFDNFSSCIHLFGDGAEKCSEVLEGRNVQIHNNINTSASAMAVLSYDKFLNKDFEDVAYFEPFYLKDFIAGPAKK